MTAPDYPALAARSIREAIEAGRLSVQLSEEDIAIITRAFREARRRKARISHD